MTTRHLQRISRLQVDYRRALRAADGAHRLDDDAITFQNAAVPMLVGLGQSALRFQAFDKLEDLVKGTISRQQERVRLELDLQEWSWLKSVILFARKASNGPLFANDVESPEIEKMARTILDELGFERLD